MNKPKTCGWDDGRTEFLLFKLTSVKLTHRFRLRYPCTGTDAANTALRNWHRRLNFRLFDLFILATVTLNLVMADNPCKDLHHISFWSS
jgi:hypothetical protein